MESSELSEKIEKIVVDAFKHTSDKYNDLDEEQKKELLDDFVKGNSFAEEQIEKVRKISPSTVDKILKHNELYKSFTIDDMIAVGCVEEWCQLEDEQKQVEELTKQFKSLQDESIR